MVSAPCRASPTTSSVRFKHVEYAVGTEALANLLVGYAPEKIQYGIDRYTNETRRLYRTMDTALSKSSSGFLVGDRVTIADISCWGWVASSSMSTSP